MYPIFFRLRLVKNQSAVYHYSVHSSGRGSSQNLIDSFHEKNFGGIARMFYLIQEDVEPAFKGPMTKRIE